jgi:hypothetical protein
VKVTQKQGHYTPSGAAVLAVISFIVGYREATFRSLVTRVVDVVLGPSGADAAAATLALVPSDINFGAVAKDQTQKFTTHLFNASGDTVHVDSTSVTVDQPSVTVTALDATDLAPSDSLAIELTWAPTAATTLAATLQVRAANLSISARLRGTSH